MRKFMSEIQFLIERRPMRSYSPGALATIALRKSAPMTGTGEFGENSVKDGESISARRADDVSSLILESFLSVARHPRLILAQDSRRRSAGLRPRLPSLP